MDRSLCQAYNDVRCCSSASLLLCCVLLRPAGSPYPFCAAALHSIYPGPCVQKQPLLHQSSPKGKEKADAPPENGNSGPAANGDEASSSDEAGESSKDRGEHWPAVQAAEANEPVGIITIEDVLEELIGQVCLKIVVHVKCQCRVRLLAVTTAFIPSPECRLHDFLVEDQMSVLLFDVSS